MTPIVLLRSVVKIINPMSYDSNTTNETHSRNFLLIVISQLLQGENVSINVSHVVSNRPFFARIHYKK